MIISVSGTPGTGKSKASRILAKMLGANLIEINKLIKKERYFSYDRKRKTKIVDVKILQKIVNKNLDRKKTNIVEGHLAHLLRSDIVLILRTNPNELKKRLKKRMWTKEKIRENVEAEVIDEITAEAIERHKKVFEIDTSKLSEKETANIMKKIILNICSRQRYLPGKIKWLERYKVELQWRL